MTPKFYKHFSLLQKTLAAFNKKCDCKGADASVSFEQSLKTRADNDYDYDLWVAKFSSETFGDQRFGGSIGRVSELVNIFIEQIVRQTLEACIANSDEWYKDKPEVKPELYELYSALSNLGGPE